MAVYALDGMTPSIDDSSYIADSAQVIGNVRIEANCTIWFGVVIRGDNASQRIEVGEGTNIQEHSVLHQDPGYPLVIGSGVTIGHRAMVHGCTIGDGSLIGIGAVVLNGARIGRNCLVGAGALVTENKEFPDGSLIIGSPARAVRPLTEEAIANLHSSARHYVQNGLRFRSGLRRID